MPVRNLRWSDRALNETIRLAEYLMNEWGEEVTLRVKEQIDNSAVRIQQSPEHFAIFSKGKNIRRCVMSRQTSIFFKVYKNEILIISVFDNRQNPKKRKL